MFILIFQKANKWFFQKGSRFGFKESWITLTIVDDIYRMFSKSDQNKTTVFIRFRFGN